MSPVSAPTFYPGANVPVSSSPILLIYHTDFNNLLGSASQILSVREEMPFRPPPWFRGPSVSSGDPRSRKNIQLPISVSARARCSTLVPQARAPISRARTPIPCNTVLSRNTPIAQDAGHQLTSIPESFPSYCEDSDFEDVVPDDVSDNGIDRVDGTGLVIDSEEEESKIVKPEGEAGRPNRGGYNLQVVLGWPPADYGKVKVGFVLRSSEINLFLNRSTFIISWTHTLMSLKPYLFKIIMHSMQSV